MAKLPNYNGSIDLIAGLRAKNNGDFPLMEAHDILVDENGKRLDEKLEELDESAGGTGSDITIISLGSNTTYTLTAEQLAALNANPEAFAFSLSDSKLSGRTVILRYHASSTATHAYVSVYAYENTIYAYQCLVTIGGGVCTVAQNSYPLGGTSTGSGLYVLELTAESGTLTDEQYNALVANAPNVSVNVYIAELGCYYLVPLSINVPEGYAFLFQYMGMIADNGDGTVAMNNIVVQVSPDKSYTVTYGESDSPTKTYVENAVANAVGGGGGIIDVTELPTENIDEKSIYRVPNEVGTKVIIYTDGDVMTYPDIVLAQGLPCEIYVVADKDEVSMKITSEAGQYIYIDKSENGIAYFNMGSGAIQMGAMMEMETKGWVTDVASITENGVYSIHGETVYTYHACKGGVWTELSKNGADIILVGVDENKENITGLTDDDYTRIKSDPYNIILQAAIDGGAVPLRYTGSTGNEFWFSNAMTDLGFLVMKTATINVEDKAATFANATIAATAT